MIDNILNGIATMVILFAMIYAPAWLVYKLITKIIER
jgi:hypothetical protein